MDPIIHSKLKRNTAALAAISNQIRQIKNTDPLTINNFVPAHVSVDSTVTIANNELTITSGAGAFPTSSQAHRMHGNGKNAIVNVVFKGDTSVPQIQFKVSTSHTNSMFSAYMSAGVPKLRRRIGGVNTDISGELDGNAANDVEATARVFNEVLDYALMQDGYVVSMMRLIDRVNLISDAFNKQVQNGLGASGVSVYKAPYRADVLSSYKNIVCVGDSNTQGLYMTFKQSYPAQLQAIFFDKNVGVVNKGVSGNKVADVEARLADLYDNYISGADNYVILQIGTNDAAVDTPAATIYAETVSKIIVPLSAKGFKVIHSTVPPRGDYADVNNIVKPLNDIIRANTPVNRLIDLYTQLVDSSDIFIPGMFHTDDKHLSESGYRMMANLIAEKISP